MSENKTYLGFEVSSKFAHFKHHETNNIKNTYSFPSRTAIAGLIGAICGLERDSYYDDFTYQTSDIAVIPTSKITTTSVPKNSLDTQDGLHSISQLDFNGQSNTKAAFMKPDDDYQREVYKYLSNPSYLIFVSLDNTELYQDLKQRLQGKDFEFTPYLGSSEMTASIEYYGEFTREETDENKVDSVLPESVGDVKVQQSTDVSAERQIAVFEEHEDGRNPIEYETYYFSKTADPISVTEDTETFILGDHIVCSK